MVCLTLLQDCCQLLPRPHGLGSQFPERVSCQQHLHHLVNPKEFAAVPTGGWAGRNLTAVFSLSLNLSLSLLLLLGKRYGQEGRVPFYLPLQFLPCIWNIPAQTIHGSDSLGEMRFYNLGYQGDPLFTKIDESCGASRYLLPCSELCASFL